MQFSKVLIAAATFALANAVPTFTMNPSFGSETYLAGSSVLGLTWSGATGPVTLYLVEGPSSALNTVATIQSNAG